MSPKPDGSYEAAQSERRWVSRSLARKGVQLGQVMTGALANKLEALEERLNSGTIPRSGGAAHGRMRELLDQDRAMVAGQGHIVRIDRGARNESAVLLPGSSKRAASAAQGRMRDLLQQDRAMLAGHDDWDELDEPEDRSDSEVAPASKSTAAVQVAEPSAAPVPVMEGASPTTAANAPVGLWAPDESMIPPPSASGVVVATGRTLQERIDAVMAATLAAADEAPLSVAPLEVVEEIASAPVEVRAPAIEPPAVVEIAPLAAMMTSDLAPVAEIAPSAVMHPGPVSPQLSAPLVDAPATADDEEGDTPIRTRTMAKLLALQGYRDRALSIYDELLVIDPSDDGLRAEADRLRN